MPGTLRFILGDQLTRSISSLDGLDRDTDTVLMVEVADETTYVRHHKQKIVLILSAMRHFADALRTEGVRVDYVELDARGNTGSFTGELERAVKRHKPERVVVTEPGEWRVWEMMNGWADRLGLPVDIREDDRFFSSRAEFARWAGSRKRLVMEDFYRIMRARTGYLMRADAPRGQRWNFDAENRKPLPADLHVPKRRSFKPDATTRAVMALVERRFADHFGALDDFGWAVTRDDALAVLEQFIKTSLPQFGDYQDAMRTGEDFLFHATLSPYINCGLLTPREVCEAAVSAHASGHAPLNAVEGFVRQILGWREYMRGVYWTFMPEYAQRNHLGAARRLPGFYWTARTEINCLHQAIDGTRRNAYAHHIQRLMVTGNFALLTGISPADINEWYLIVYADAYEWVELPNTHGMSIYADGGMLGTKPYAASGAYINRMSDYCKGCVYNPRLKSGAKACPFNYLYWNFLLVNEAKLQGNPRMRMPYRTLGRMTEKRRDEILKDSRDFLRERDAQPYEAA